MQKIKAENPLKRHLYLMVLTLFIIQPLLDVLSYLTDKLGISNIYTLGLRSAIMLAVLVTAFLITDK